MSIKADWAMIHRAIENAEWGQKELVKERFCDRLGIHKSTLHRKLKKRFGQKRTLNREYDFDPDNRLCNIVFKMKLQGEMMHLKRRELSTENCIKLMCDMGVAGSDHLYTVDERTGEVRYKVSTVNRRLRDMGYREPQPSMRIESDYANQVHMIDFSRSKYFQLFDRDERTGDYMLKVSGRELHYKLDDTRLRTWIVQYMDDYSRLRKSRAYPETNESAFLGLEHLNYVYGPLTPGLSPAGEGSHPLKYLPLQMLRCDNGSFRRSSETVAAMEAMDIYMPPQMPDSKGGTAKVENRMRSLWQQFELPLAVRLGDGGRIWLSEYNELLEEFCINEQADQHPYERDITKGERYERSLADRSILQKTTDADMIRIACRVDRRVVDAHLRVSLDNVYYSVPQYVSGISTMGKTVSIHRNKYGELTGKLINDLATGSFALEQWKAASWSEFSMHTQTEKRKTEVRFNRENTRLSDIIGEYTYDSSAGAPASASEEHPSKSPLVRGDLLSMPPRVGSKKADSPFAPHPSPLPGGEGAGGRVFRNLLDAKEHVGVRIAAIGLNWADVDTYFSDLLKEPPVTEFELSQRLEKIYDDYDEGQLASNF